MKRIRTTFALAIIAGLALAAQFRAARAGNAASLPQTASKPCGTVTVAAASDLTYAMNEIAANFEKATGCTVRLSMGSSGNFLTQIENGAPFDVFFSADIAYPKKLEAEGLAAPGSTYLYAIGKIVLWTRKDSRVDVGKGFAALRDPAVQKIAIANPEHAPYGRAAEEALRHSGVYDAVKDRLVLGENISQAAEFVESGNADAGIVALSLVLSPAMKDKGRAVEYSGKFVHADSAGGRGCSRGGESARRAAISRLHQNCPQRPRCWSDMDLRFQPRFLLGGNLELGGDRAFAEAGGLRCGNSPGRGPAHCLLGDVLALALEISGRSDRRAAAGSCRPPCSATTFWWDLVRAILPAGFGNRGSGTRFRSRSADCLWRPCSTACRSPCSRFRPDLKGWTAG